MCHTKKSLSTKHLELFRYGEENSNIDKVIFFPIQLQNIPGKTTFD